ncbi:MAG: hypothetical protein EOO20_05260 [Chryseobacterium sp.]|nr:MAG: hypothetical protein EOO20_05260 [Chryseobacterium sp.]
MPKLNDSMPVEKTKKPKKEKLPKVPKLAETPEWFFNQLDNPDTWLIGVDQALDRVGLGIMLPRMDVLDLRRVLKDISVRIEAFDCDLNALEDLRLENEPYQLPQLKVDGQRMKKRSETTVRIGKADSVGRRSVMVCSSISFPVDKDPEWMGVARRAGVICDLIQYFDTEFGSQKKGICILEEMAMHGHSSSIPILLVLSQLYGAIYREFFTRFTDSESVSLYDLSISTWKKRFTGKGNANKKEILEIWRSNGLDIHNDDAADAMSIAMVAGEYGEDVLKYSRGRMMR